MHMPEEVANFLLTHVPRDMTNLISVLDALDALSLQEKRKLTIPFVKSALNI
jgi:DnaA family protein